MDYDRLRAVRMEFPHSYTARDTILYALGVGAGSVDPEDARELAYVYEQDLRALPTMAVVLGYPGFWMKDPLYGIAWQRILHGEQSTTLHQPLPVEGKVVGVLEIDDIFDKGADKGAVVYSSRRIYDQATGDLLATVSSASFLRGDGGGGGRTDGAPRPHPMPADRPPDLVRSLPTRRDQALLYRLSGDLNPVHADPEAARAGGLPRPILHGLCTYGVAGRAILAGLLGHDPAALRRFDVRFSSPVFPGETIRVELWREGDGRAALRASVEERDVVVLQNGYVEYASA